MTDLRATHATPPETGAVRVSGLFRDRYPEMVRLANLLGADDPEDIAQEAFARLIRKAGSLRDPAAALGSTTTVNYALGYAPANVARLELRFPNGTTYAGTTVPAWQGSNERLWVRTGLPRSGIPQQTLVISYNAAGQVIAQQTLASLG